MGKFEYIIGGIALVIIAPALIAGAGLAIAVGLALAWVIGTFGGRYYFRVKEKQNIGRKQAERKGGIRDRLNGGNGGNE